MLLSNVNMTNGLRNFLKIKMIIIEKYSCYTSSKVVVLEKKKTKIECREINLQKRKIKFDRSEFLTETRLCC